MSGNIRYKVLADIGMGVTMLVSLVTGIVLWLVLPHGRYAGKTIFLGLTRLIWNDIHLYTSLVFSVILLIHLALNIRLFIGMAKSLFKKDG